MSNPHKSTDATMRNPDIFVSSIERSNSASSRSIGGGNTVERPHHDFAEPFPTLSTPSHSREAPIPLTSINTTPLTRDGRLTASNIAPPDLARPTLSSGTSFRLRRLPSSSAVPRAQSPQEDVSDRGRRRSTSAPTRPLSGLSGQDGPRQGHGLSAVDEEPAVVDPQDQQTLGVPHSVAGRIRAASNTTRARLSRQRSGSNASRNSFSVLGTLGRETEYNSDVINMLDVIDPQVATLTTLNNVQNSLFIPYLGRYFNRTPTYDLSQHINEDLGKQSDQSKVSTGKQPERIDPELAAAELTEEYQQEQKEEVEEVERTDDEYYEENRLTHSHTLSSIMTGTNYAVLPHGVSLEGWSAEDKEALNDHVRHLLHSRRAAFKRGMKGFYKYVQKPLGAFVTIYAFLLTFWGAAWVLFLIGWIHAGDRQAYFVEICDQVLTALFCMVGLGLAPFRIVDTYHMIYIAHYHYLTWKLRQERNMPPLEDPNDLPEPAEPGADLEAAEAEKINAEMVLTPEQERKFLYHQRKYMKSHTFYKPHETITHNAFSVKLLITVTVLLDFHSIFQACLGGTTWGIKYTHRPKALTAVILTCSICCNISGGITIAVGDRKSRKKKIVEQMFRQALTQTAMDELKKERGLEPSTSK